MQTESGTLYVVATPIGNLGDMSERAVETLSNVRRIYAEDTRHSRRLLSHLGVTTPLVALHEHNEVQQLERVLAFLVEEGDAAIISDAGTPLISDPGYRLVRACHARGVKVSPVPGASALIAALSVAGLPTDAFVFVGFAPSKEGARRTWLEALKAETRTVVMYESCHRIEACLADMATVFGEARELVVGRELTKRFESVQWATVAEHRERIAHVSHADKGEFVLVLAGCAAEPTADAEIVRVLGVLRQQLSLKQSVVLAAQILGEKKNRVYQVATALERDGADK